MSERQPRQPELALAEEPAGFEAALEDGAAKAPEDAG